MDTVKFTRMADGDRDDYALLDRHERAAASSVGSRLLTALDTLADEPSAYRISKREHSLQCASRAYLDGADTDWVVAALLHDVGDLFAPYNHDEFAAAMLRPYLREQCTWVIGHHGLFLRYYYAHHFGGDREARQKFKENPFYHDAIIFCERWDQVSYDPTYRSLPMETFRPMVDEVFAREPYAACTILPAVRVPMTDGRTAEQRRQTGAQESAA